MKRKFKWPLDLIFMTNHTTQHNLQFEITSESFSFKIFNFEKNETAQLTDYNRIVGFMYY